MKRLFKWNGDWHTVPDKLRKDFGQPVTNVRNLGVWRNGHFINCRVGDYVIKKNNQYGVIRHE